MKHSDDAKQPPLGSMRASDNQLGTVVPRDIKPDTVRRAKIQAPGELAVEAFGPTHKAAMPSPGNERVLVHRLTPPVISFAAAG